MSSTCNGVRKYTAIVHDRITVDIMLADLLRRVTKKSLIIFGYLARYSIQSYKLEPANKKTGT